MVDIHCHILPGVDDGAKSWEIAIEMCASAVADGIDHVVATPHANEEFTYDRVRNASLLEELGQKAPKGPAFSLGCDFHFSFENIQDLIRNREKYLISGTSYLLIELSDFSVSPTIDAAVSRIVTMGITPILTHPERNMILQSDPERIIRFAENGCVIQVTANSITGFWGDRPKKISHWLLERDAVHVISTDAHDLHRRPLRLSDAYETVRRTYGVEVAAYLTDHNPRAIVQIQPIPYAPAIRAK